MNYATPRALANPRIAAKRGASSSPNSAAARFALFMQAVVHGAFVISNAGGDPALAAQGLDHLEQYLTLLFSRQFGAR